VDRPELTGHNFDRHKVPHPIMCVLPSTPWSSIGTNPLLALLSNRERIVFKVERPGAAGRILESSTAPDKEANNYQDGKGGDCKV